MAQKKSIKKAPQNELPGFQEVFEATFDKIAEKGLGKTRVSDLAESLGVPFNVFYTAYPSVESILGHFLNYVDQCMVETVSIGDTDSKRDLYFDMLMSRFDTMQDYRDGVKRWLKDTSKHPFLWSRLLKRWEQTLSLMLDIAKDSPVFAIKKIGLAAIYLSALREWLDDDSDDLSKTMITIDKALGKADDFVATFLTKKKA